MSSVKEIEHAIQTLPAAELEELTEWFEQYRDSFDERLASDLASGRLDPLIGKALEQERNGEMRPL